MKSKFYGSGDYAVHTPVARLMCHIVYMYGVYTSYLVLGSTGLVHKYNTVL